MKYFKGIYSYLKTNDCTTYDISNDDYQLYEKEENKILKCLGNDFKNKYLSFDKLHDCPITSVNMNFNKNKNDLKLTFLYHENNQKLSIIYKDICNCEFKLNTGLISKFNSLEGNMCLISEFSKSNDFYTHEMAFSDGSQIIVNFINPKNVLLTQGNG